MSGFVKRLIRALANQDSAAVARVRRDLASAGRLPGHRRLASEIGRVLDEAREVMSEDSAVRIAVDIESLREDLAARAKDRGARQEKDPAARTVLRRLLASLVQAVHG